MQSNSIVFCFVVVELSQAVAWLRGAAKKNMRFNKRFERLKYEDGQQYS